MTTIKDPYLLIINIPLHRDLGGVLYGDPLWLKDVAGHLTYLEHLSLACPVLSAAPTPGMVKLSDVVGLGTLPVIELPYVTSLSAALLALPRTAGRLIRAMAPAKIIHTGIAGWPIPYGWLVTPLAMVLQKQIMLIVESAPWRLNPAVRPTLKSRLVAAVYETIATWCIRRADLVIFTHEKYRLSFLGREAHRGHIIHASWIDGDMILSEQRAETLWRKKTAADQSVFALLFAGRLEPQKGLLVLLDAIRLLAQRNIDVRLDILGEGSLAERCREACAEFTQLVRVNLLGTVAYGPPLFTLLQEYHALVLPSLSDEQPRIVYDAYSQGVAVLGTQTDGLRDCVVDDTTGWLVKPNAADALAALIERASGHREDLHRMGMNALRKAHSMTHQVMHRERQKLLLKFSGAAE